MIWQNEALNRFSLELKKTWLKKAEKWLRNLMERCVAIAMSDFHRSSLKAQVKSRRSSSRAIWRKKIRNLLMAFKSQLSYYQVLLLDKIFFLLYFCFAPRRVNSRSCSQVRQVLAQTVIVCNWEHQPIREANANLLSQSLSYSITDLRHKPLIVTLYHHFPPGD